MNEGGPTSFSRLSARLKGDVREALGLLAVYDEYTLSDLASNRADLVVLLETAALNRNPSGAAT